MTLATAQQPLRRCGAKGRGYLHGPHDRKNADYDFAFTMRYLVEQTNASFRSDFQERGVAHVRAFISDRAARDLLQITDHLYDEIGAAAAGDKKIGGGDAGPHLVSGYRQWSGLQLNHVAEFLRATNPDLSLRFQQTAIEIAENFRRLFDSHWQWAAQSSFFRRAMKGYASTTAWHTDAEAAETLRIGPRFVNVWLPLTTVGGSSEMPSLEFVCGSHRLSLAQWGELKLGNHRSDDWVATIDGERLIPEAKLGDAAVFDHFTLHRTQQLPRQIAPRTSCEFRFAPRGIVDYRAESGWLLLRELGRRVRSRISKTIGL